MGMTGLPRGPAPTRRAKRRAYARLGRTDGHAQPDGRGDGPACGDLDSECAVEVRATTAVDPLRDLDAVDSRQPSESRLRQPMRVEVGGKRVSGRDSHVDALTCVKDTRNAFFTDSDSDTPASARRGARVGAKKTDVALRERLSRWLRYYQDRYGHEYETQGAFASALGTSGPAISQILSGKRTMGLDLLVSLHRRLHVSIDVMIATDPPRTRPSPDSASPRRPERRGD